MNNLQAKIIATAYVGAAFMMIGLAGVVLGKYSGIGLWLLALSGFGCAISAVVLFRLAKDEAR